MKLLNNITLLSMILLSCAGAEVPQKVAISRYSGLWNNSPFTSKPAANITESGPNPLNDFILTGIAPVPGGYRITIANKKDNTKKEVIEPGGNSKFKVISVERNPETTLGTVVVLSFGSNQGSVTFQPDLVKLTTAPAAPVVNQQAPNLPPGVDTQANRTPPNVPRPRIVPLDNKPKK